MCNTTCTMKWTCFIRKQTVDHSTIDPTVFRQVLQCEIQREETSCFFSLSQHKRHWGRVRDNTTHLSSYVKSSVSCSYKKLSLIQFNIQKIRYGEERFRSNIHVRRNLRISCNISHFNIFLSIIFQVCLLSNKESFFKDMRYFRYIRKDPI